MLQRNVFNNSTNTWKQVKGNLFSEKRQHQISTESSSGEFWVKEIGTTEMHIHSERHNCPKNVAICLEIQHHLITKANHSKANKNTSNFFQIACKICDQTTHYISYFPKHMFLYRRFTVYRRTFVKYQNQNYETNLKQTSHPTKSTTKVIRSQKVIFFMLSHTVIFCDFQPNSVRKPLKQSQNIGWNHYVTRSKLHPANWTHLGTLRMFAKT